jgi:pyrimidine-nucleoside phosphorylase
MNATHIIARKRDGTELSPDEISWLISGYTRGDVPDYQMAAFAMAVCCRGMTAPETAALTASMLGSGVTLEWPGEDRPVVDKHSTGGIGDKVSLVLAPLLACCDVVVPMISGRGLGPTGGTLDKLESIPGFRTDLSLDELQRITRDVGCVICGTTAEIAPADRKLYALRDVTGTVPSIPLITASIMSKKLAEGLGALVLDVKCGTGAFMSTPEQAHELAREMVAVGTEMGVGTSALITDMNQPLGRCVGNALEVNEAIAALQGDGPRDLAELTLALGAQLLVAAGRHEQPAAATADLQGHLNSGRGFEKFSAMVAAQGGDLSRNRVLADAHDWTAADDGWVHVIDASQFGSAVIELGGGRTQAGDSIDHSVGLECLVRCGDPVQRGQPLVRVYAGGDGFERIKPFLERALEITATTPSETGPLIISRTT